MNQHEIIMDLVAKLKEALAERGLNDAEVSTRIANLLESTEECYLPNMTDAELKALVDAQLF